MTKPLYFTALITILLGHQAVSQHLLTTFGSVSELKAIRGANTLVSGDFNDDGVIDVATSAGKKIQIYLQSDSSRWRSFSWYADDSVSALLSARLNRDNLTDFVLLTADQQELLTYLAKPNEKFYLAWSKRLEIPSDKVLIADINSDNKQDIILYGKKQQGIKVLAGKGNGSFKTETQLFFETSFSMVFVADINEDGMNDLLALNWITNELLLYSAVGRMKFAEPSTMSFQNEPAIVAVADIDGDRNNDIVVGFADERQYQTFFGDGLGGFRPGQTTDLGSFPTQFVMQDLNGDTKPDIGILSAQEHVMRIGLNNGKGIFEEHVDFDAGVSPVQCVLLPSSSAQIVDAAVLDQSTSRIRIFHSDRKATRMKEEQSYAVGLHPTDVVCYDVNRDGWNDIITANAGSQNISILMNRKDGTFRGQIAFGLPSKLERLHVYPLGDSLLMVVGTHHDFEKISTTTINPNDFSSVSYSLPTIDSAEIIGAMADPRDQQIQINVLEHEKNAQNISLIEYDQIDSTRFIQRDITPRIVKQIVAATMADLDHDGKLDLVYIGANSKNKILELYCSFKKDDDSFTAPVVSFLSKNTQSNPLIWVKDINHDGFEDIIVHVQDPEYPFLILRGSADMVLAQPLLLPENNITVARSNDLQFADLNVDGVTDMIIRNSSTKTIQAYIGKGDGSFLPMMRLMSSDGIGGFAFTDTDHDDLQELIFTETMSGKLKIISLEERP